jgi:hypothetical protein
MATGSMKFESRLMEVKTSALALLNKCHFDRRTGMEMAAAMRFE